MTDDEYYELKVKLWARQEGMCAHCNAPISMMVSEVAHRIPQADRFVERYGRKIIDHELNTGLVCIRSDRCNSGLDIRNHPVQIEELVDRIRRALGE